MIKTCDYPGCTKESKFLMSWDNKNGKHSGLVCATHDKELGRKNLMRAGMTFQEAIAFERYLAQTVEDASPIDWPEWFKLQTGIASTPLKKAHQPLNTEKQPVTLLDLSPKIQNTLRRNDVTTIEQLTNMSDPELLRMRTMGKTSLSEIRKRLERLGQSK